MRLSLIIPVYNTELYLEESLNSLSEIDLQDVEFLCIDDGSTDHSLDILHNYQKKDPRFIVIHKENTGYGNTMNIGLEKAKGQYVGILESDDILVKGAMEKLLSVALSTNADVVKGNYYQFKDNINNASLFENMKDIPYDVCINSINCMEVFLTGPAIWSAIYKKELLDEKGICFLNTPGASYQDTSFAFKVWTFAARIIAIHDPVIFYRLDNASSSSNSGEKVFEIFRETEEMNRHLKTNKMEYFTEICMVAKFRSYKWNLDRLNNRDKVRFLMRMHEDAKTDLLAGRFQKRYWRDYDWMIMNNVLFNITGYCKAVEIGQEPRFRNEAIYESLKGIPLYIISASREGEVMLAEIWNYGMDICGYINHELIKDMVSISAPVVEIDQIDQHSLVLVSLNEPKLEKLIGILDKKHLSNYVII